MKKYLIIFLLCLILLGTSTSFAFYNPWMYLYDTLYPYNYQFVLPGMSYYVNTEYGAGIGPYSMDYGYDSYYTQRANIIGWPLSYALISNTQKGYGASYSQSLLGIPINYYNASYDINYGGLFYSPYAFAYDLGLNAYYTGINNFLLSVF